MGTPCSVSEVGSTRSSAGVAKGWLWIHAHLKRLLARLVIRFCVPGAQGGGGRYRPPVPLYGTPLTQIWCFLRPGPHTGGGVTSRMRLTPPTRRM